ncbi:MAG TPA: glucose-1-phosphate thymidylyltransferase [Archaeoglobaceae archaeon]|nr:glucose-1-phosphate thymidylyltransferase [Archaeoglobaceae archaeon]
MKGLVLSGGFGTRLRPLTYSQQKQLIPVANKPILFYAIEDVIEAGVDEIYIIVGPNKEQVIEVVKSEKWDAEIDFIYQSEPKGLAHAVKISQDYIGDESFVMYLGDNVLKGGITRFADEFITSDADASILLTEVSNPQQFGVAELNEDGSVKRLIEKPKKPPSNYALVGIYFFKPVVFEAVNSIKPSWRDELEITDAIQWLIENGYRVKSNIVKDWWKDTGKPEDILEANRLVLDEIEHRISGEVENSGVMGRVIVELGTLIKNSSVKGPCIIGKNCRIINSYIGPYTSIGNECEIIDTEIEDSVVMDECRIINAGRIVEGLIGKGVEIVKGNAKPKGNRFVVGDHSKIIMG